MPGPAATLRELHRLRRHAKNLQDEIERLPRQFKAQQARVAQQEKVHKQTTDQITKLKLGIKDKEGKLKDTHVQLAKYEKQKEMAASLGKKEYDALQVEIQHSKETAAKLENDILTIMEEVDKLQARLPELEKAIAQAKQELAQWDKTVKERQGALQGELQQVMAQIKQVEPNLPDDIRQQYERLVAYRGEDSLATVNGRSCHACYTEITAQMQNNLIQGLFVLCKSCGRILYLPEEPAQPAAG
jgi:hypothetical protein